MLQEIPQMEPGTHFVMPPTALMRMYMKSLFSRDGLDDEDPVAL